MLIEKKKIAIVGGGPGGLMLARLMQRAGAKVTVYERNANREVRQQGATLDLHEESGLLAMQAAGLMEAFIQHYRPGADKTRIVDETGKIYLDDHADEANADTVHARPEIDRGPLRDILIDSLLPDTIVWNAQLESLEKSRNGWTLNFKNGSSATADLVVAADGANSRIRKYLTDIQPIYSGVTIVEGNIYHATQNAPRLHDLVKGGKVFALGKEKSLILSAKGDGCLSFYTGTKEAENWVTASGIEFNHLSEVFNWFRERFADWDVKWHELFATDQMYVVPRPMYHYPLDQRWETQSDLTMLGDAAHRMPPYAGEGVNMALLDALALSECLTSDRFATLHDAIAHFEQGMCARMATMTEMTLFNTQLLHAPDALKGMLQIVGRSEAAE